jgi:hypothetical protein
MKRKIPLPDNEEPAKRQKRLQEVANLPPRLVIGIPTSPSIPPLPGKEFCNPFMVGWAFGNEHPFTPYIQTKTETKGTYCVYTLQDWEALLNDDDSKFLAAGRSNRSKEIQRFVPTATLADLVQQYCPFEETVGRGFWVRWHEAPLRSGLSRPVLAYSSRYVTAIGFLQPTNPWDDNDDEECIIARQSVDALQADDDASDSDGWPDTDGVGDLSCPRHGCFFGSAWLDFPQLQPGIMQTSAVLFHSPR